MQGVAIFLFCLFVTCWIVIFGYHLGVEGFDSLGRTAVGSSTLVVAYTGAALSVVSVAMVALAAIINR